MQIGDKDLDKIDPDWKFAYLHARSTKPGNCIQQVPELCQCCLNIIHKQQISLGVHSKQLQFLGFGFPLFYTFLKYCAILVLMLILSQSCISVYKAVQLNKQYCGVQYSRLFFASASPVPERSFLASRKNLHSSQQSSHSPAQYATQKYKNARWSFINQLNKRKNREEKSSQVPASQQAGHVSLLTPSANDHQSGNEGHHELGCTGIFILLSRTDKEIDDPQTVLRVSTFFLCLVTLIFIRDHLYKTQQYYDERRCSLSDYSIIISKLPQVQGIQSMILKFFSEGFLTAHKVEQLVLIPQFEQLQQVQQQKSHLIVKLQDYYKKGKQKYEGQVSQLQRQIQKLGQQQNHAVIVFNRDIKADKLPSERAIIVLSTQLSKESVLTEFQGLGKQVLARYFGNQGVEVQMQQAPQPRQIIYQNMNYPSTKRFGRVLLGWALSIIFITLITVVFYFILRWKTFVVEEEESLARATIIVFAALILVILFNKFVMGNVLHYFTHIQKHATSDRQQFSFAFKYSLGMFFTTALMTLFVEAITYNNFYKHHYGVIEQQSIMFFMNSFLVPIIWMINPFQIVVLIKRNLNYGKKHLTQREANHLMQDFHYDVGKRYAEILQTMWFTFLYVSLIPMGSFLTLIGIGLYYWVDKYNLLRRSSIHQNVSGKLSIVVLKLLDLVVIFKPLGQIIFDHFLRNQIRVSSFITLLIGIIYVVLPVNEILDHFNKENFHLQEKSYRDIKQTFKDDYFQLHPMYSKSNPEMMQRSRRLYKESILSKYINPVLQYAMGSLDRREIIVAGKDSIIKNTVETANPSSNFSPYSTNRRSSRRDSITFRNSLIQKNKMNSPSQKQTKEERITQQNRMIQSQINNGPLKNTYSSGMIP